MKNRKGISLIVLIITMIVILIIASVIIITLTDNNVISQAKEAQFRNNIAQYKEELSLATTNRYLYENDFKPSEFNAPAWSGEGNGNGTIKEYITSIKKDDGKSLK